MRAPSCAFYVSRASVVLLLAVGLLSLAGCDASVADYPAGTSLRPGWVKGQEFHIETRYRNIIRHTSSTAETLDPAVADSGEVVALVDVPEDSLGDATYWRYQVIEQGLRPAPGDPFHPYSVLGGTPSRITVIKASLDPEMNIGSELASADPKIYMVFREDRLRMAGIVAFHTAAGERVSEALTIDAEQMNRSFSVLSQSSLSVVPHFVPPFPIRKDNVNLVLEDGQEVTYTNARDGRIDVVYENALDNTLIAETWSDGLPWSTLSITPTSESRMMSPQEVYEVKGAMAGTMSDSFDTDDFDYVSLLRAPVNLSDALRVDELLGRHSFEVHEGYRPWAGSWWRQSEGALVFGYHMDFSGGSGAFPGQSSTHDTLSDLRRSEFEEPARRLQDLGDVLRDLRGQGLGQSSEYAEKLEEYRGAQDELTEEVSEFYGAVRQAISGGQIAVNETKIEAAEGWNGDSEDPYPAFEFDLGQLSPLDKFALMQQLNSPSSARNPWFGPAWELLNHWSPAGSDWWGHCNGWSAAAILTNQPEESTDVSFGMSDEHTLELTAADQKGLLSESHYSTLSSFYGARYDGADDDDISDLSPTAVLQLLSTYIGQRGVPLVFDTSPGEQVWNYPAWAYELTLEETGGPVADSAAGRVNINLASEGELQILDGIGPVLAEAIVDHREANGPFQQVEDLTDVWGIGPVLLSTLREHLTVSQAGALRQFDGSLRVRFSTDGVGYTHIDEDPDQPKGHWSTWRFTLQANDRGEMVDGQWQADDKDHPDFAWVPYANTEQSGRSENPYLNWNALQGYLPGVTRE